MPAALVHPAAHPPAAAREAADAELVRDLRAGDDRAATRLVQRHEAALLGYARGVLGGAHHDAEECVQDAFVRALASLRRRPDQEILLTPWLYAIVRNACLDRLRRPQRTVGLDALQGVLADGAAGPHEVAARREELRGVLTALRGLPDRQRRALVALELEGRPHEELAAGLGVSVGASKALVCRARQGLAHLRTAA